MRKGGLFALGMFAAALLGQVSLTLAEHAQSPKAESSNTQSSGTQAKSSGQQSTRTSGQQAATPQSQHPGQQGATRQNQQAGQHSETQQGQPIGKQASGQRAQPAPPPAIPPGYRLLTLSEGRAIVQGMAWTDDEEGLSPDCSHLVHKLYDQAGHPYPYASSLDLYGGTGPFFRVRYAHPGDLVVWRGHVGIVVSPKEHSFFSTTSAGTRLEDYRSAYWRARGYPHFFRYLTKSPLKTSGSASETANRLPQH